MASPEKDKAPMPSVTYPRSLDPDADSRFQNFVARARSASISIPMESFENKTNLVGYTGPLCSGRKAPIIQSSGPLFINRKTNNLSQSFNLGKNRVRYVNEGDFPGVNGMDQNNLMDDQCGGEGQNEHLLRSGQLGMCNDPYCTTCPTYYKLSQPKHKPSRVSGIFDQKYSAIYGDAKGWATTFFSILDSYIPIMNPHARAVRLWNKYFAFSCLVAIFLDPLFVFPLSVQEDKKCIDINWPITATIMVLRSMTDIIYLANILLQFRLAFVAPESRVLGAGELVAHPMKIAKHYFCGYLFYDLFAVLPLPQIMIGIVLPKHLGASGPNFAKSLLWIAVLMQYIPRLFRFLPLIIGQSPTGFVFETAWANFFINLLTYMLFGHGIGSCWYLFGLQRVNQCLRKACHDPNHCSNFIDCRDGISYRQRTSWINNVNATACFTTNNSFAYGIYDQAVQLTTEGSIATRYIYSVFWGFQQISTLAGNQTPTNNSGEVIFTMVIIGLGLLLFAFLIGNMQNFLQALGRRRLEMSLRRREVEQWMSRRRLPQDLRRKVLEAERYNWAATRGINEEELLGNLPEDLQRDIRRHLFKLVKKVWIFAMMDEHVLDAVCERLKPRIYIMGSEILSRGGPLEKMIFIVRGKLESVGEYGSAENLSEGNVCGEELLTWSLENSYVSKDAKKIKFPGQRLLSSRTVRCLTNVEAFSLRDTDLEEVTSLFARNLLNPRVQGAIRYQSPYWRSIAATRIQVAWRYRQKRMKHLHLLNQTDYQR